MFLSMRFYCLIIFTACLFLVNTPVKAGDKEKKTEEVEKKADKVEEKEAPKIEYKNPFESLQKQRAIYQAKKEKAILKATLKEGLKTKRVPSKSKSAIMYGKKIGQINGKIRMKYISLVKLFVRIPRLQEKVKALNERLKMTDSTDGTMEQIKKAELDILELKKEFEARVLAFEPIPSKLEEQYKWLKEYTKK